ncbi:MAG: peptidylprolyl isomerase [Candidatus Competibacteraceae bacterium]|jgi:parvulin-like peptidyl-prolyl isomerase|nr:peptidylprolyl isomerase [Candidatus Competibacteraceae bacterium]
MIKPLSAVKAQPFATVLILLLLMANLCQAAQQETVLATYGKGEHRQTVTAEQLADWKQYGFGSQAVRREFAIRELILVETLAAEAKRLALDRQPKAKFELTIKEAALSRPLLRKQLVSLIRISAAQVEAKYQSIKDTYTRPRRVRLYNIFKRYPPNATTEDKVAILKQMQSIRQRLLDGADFGQIAEAESDSQTRFRKGLIGNVPAGNLRPEIDAVAMTMKAGEISEILPGPNGLTILYCERILPKVQRNPEELREIAKNLLENQTFDQRWAQLLADLLARANPRYHWPVLEHYAEKPDAILVEFRGGALSVRQVEWLINQGRNTPLSRSNQTALRRRVENYLINHMGLQDLIDQGLHRQPEFKSRRSWMRKQWLTQQILVQRIQRQLTPPGEAEIERYFQAHRDTFKRPPHYDLSVIAMPLAQDDKRKTYRQGERIVNELHLGELDFPTAARRYSQDTSAADGGRLGEISRLALPRRLGLDVLRAVLKMQVGEVSDLVESDRGILWILQLHGVTEERPMTFAEARRLAENRLGNERVQALEGATVDAWLESLQIRFEPQPDSS